MLQKCVCLCLCLSVCVLLCLFVRLCGAIDVPLVKLVGSIKSQVFFAKEPYKRDYILQKRPIICVSFRAFLSLQELLNTHTCMIEIAMSQFSFSCRNFFWCCNLIQLFKRGLLSLIFLFRDVRRAAAQHPLGHSRSFYLFLITPFLLVEFFFFLFQFFRVRCAAAAM